MASFLQDLGKLICFDQTQPLKNEGQEKVGQDGGEKTCWL